MEPLNIFNNEISGEICCICLNNMDNELLIHKIAECNHKFHSSCLIEWLRTSNQCPMCRNEKTFYRNKSSLFRIIIDFLKGKKNKNKHLQILYKKYKTTKNNYEKEKKSQREFKKEHKTFIKQYNDKKRKNRQLSWKLQRIRRQIYDLPIVPILIKK
jgi:hypothetical protein